LSIAKQIVAQLGGEIGFEPAPDGGTIFNVAFPAFDHGSDHAAGTAELASIAS
jgi:signal transduction histidine kinase